ncbi:MAG: reverse transcriptase family protein, partial [Candidatus Thiodiazotropha endolucinida]|nr:reverse transcriptase family protein [Candidatus Thiodiazotropha taylori]MCW4341990.1 reverse transcriptase family protein [Candidatus Thiodiazotropha endolucinida]
CNVPDDDALNVSSHRPILMQIELPHVEQTGFHLSTTNPVKWRGVKMDAIDQYRIRLDDLCLSRTTNRYNTYMENDIDALYFEIISMIKSSSDCLPHRKEFNKHLKPYWDQTLKELHKLMLEKRKSWVLDDRPRGSSYISYREYKNAKRVFRQYHRVCSENYIKTLNEEIDKAAGLDSGYFWNLVNKRRTKSSCNIGAEVRFSGRVYRDSQQICDQWKQYFHQLYSSTECDNFDTDHYDDVTARVDNLKRQSFNENDVEFITERELNDAISQLNKGKASGDDGVDNEHIIYSGHVFRNVLLTMYNSMLLRSYIPNDMKTGIIITLFKGGNKRKDDPDSYRAITLTSCVLKLFERILLNRILSSHRPFNPLQGGFQKGMACTMTSFLVRESVYYAKENGSKLYICFLDAKKAFDKVWHDGLLLKLHERGVELYIWKVLVCLHANLTSYVFFKGCKSSRFSVTKGTRQGGVLSPYLFLCFIDDLLHELCSSNMGLTVHGVNVCCPTVADDMLLQALTKFGLQVLINICVRYFNMWRLEHNALKCNVLVCNETDAEYKRCNRRWMLGTEELRETDNYTHLGVICTKNMDTKLNIDVAASQIRRIFFGLVSSSFSEHDLHPLTWKSIYETVVLPKALYGCEMWMNITHSDMLKLERSHRLCLKAIQCVDRQTRTTVALGLIGSINIQYEIEKRKANLFGQLCRLDPHFAVKRLFIQRLTSGHLFHVLRFGFVSELLRLLDGYNLGYIVHGYINTGVFPSKHTWKKLIRDNINLASTISTRNDIIDNGLERFLSIHAQMKPSYFWDLSRKHPHMLNACRSMVQLIASTFNRYQPESICLACGVHFSKYVDHCLLWCNANAHVRHNMWVGIWHKYGIDLYLRLAGLSHDVLIEVFFGRFDVIADVLAETHKDAFYRYIAQLMHIQKRICVKPVG